MNRDTCGHCGAPEELCECVVGDLNALTQEQGARIADLEADVERLREALANCADLMSRLPDIGGFAGLAILEHARDILENVKKNEPGVSKQEKTRSHACGLEIRLDEVCLRCGKKMKESE